MNDDVEALISGRETAYKFLLRVLDMGYGVSTPSIFSKLQQYLLDNEKKLIARSVDVSKLKYNISSSLLPPSFIGLFWFSSDYSKVIEPIGFREFSPGDVVAKMTVKPDGEHNNYESNTSKLPRGRVSLINGEVVINVGLKCPDWAVGMVVDFFGLYDYRDKLRIGRGYHWDPK